MARFNALLLGLVIFVVVGASDTSDNVVVTLDTDENVVSVHDHTRTRALDGDQFFIPDHDQCPIERVFPESGLDDETDDLFREITRSDETEDCDSSEETDSMEAIKCKPECAKCCKIGAYAGKKYRRKHRCPYMECRRLFYMFYKKYRRHIKHPHVCGFAFVKCCERQHHKELYSPSDTIEYRH